MNNSRKRLHGFSRKEGIRNELKSVNDRSLLTFSFKNLDETQPKKEPETLEKWKTKNLLKSLILRLKELSKLTRQEAEQQKQIKLYTAFPPHSEFSHPKHVDQYVEWAVIKNVGGQKGVIAGYLVESTFYIVFLDQNHKFWITKKRRT